VLKRTVIHQPDFLPYLGFFHRLLSCELLILLDNVQFVQNNRDGWTHRDKIKTPSGAKWLTISVKKAPWNTAIRDIQVATTTNWRDANLKLIKGNYQGAPYFKEIYPYMEELYHYECDTLCQFTIRSIEILMRLLDIRVPLLFASALSPQGNKSELLLDVLRKVSATHYLSGSGAKCYLDPKLFAEAGIEIIWQNFSHPVYHQLHGNFIPYLSSIDVLFNCGIRRSREVLRAC
jgi:WbqC-like protein family